MIGNRLFYALFTIHKQSANWGSGGAEVVLFVCFLVFEPWIVRHQVVDSPPFTMD